MPPSEEETPGKESKRLFIGIDLPPEVRAQLDDLLVRLKTGCRFVDSHPKWVSVQNLHITLVFLGQIAATQVDQIKESIQQSSGLVDPFELGVMGLGLFPPDSRAPRVLSTDVVDKSKQLKKLYEALAENLRSRGFEVQDRAFRPHLTLARLTSIKTSSRLGPLVTSHAGFLNAKFPVEEVVLFESIQISGGTRYEAVFTHRLGS